MDNIEIGKYTRSFGVSFGIASVFSALLVILKETNEDTVLAWMKAASGHHWITHGILNLILFVVLGWALSRLHNGRGVNISTNGLIYVIAGSIFVSGILIVGFYLLH
jgi:hypothetical protein